MKQFFKWLGRTLCLAMAAILVYIGLAFFGNPVSWTIAKINTSRYMEQNFGDSHFQVSKVGYNFKTGGYYAFIDSPTSQDSYFTIEFDGWGRYRYDTYENVTDGSNTLRRIDLDYSKLVDSKLQNGVSPFDTSIVIGELRPADLIEVYSYTDENDNTIVYSIDKEYGLDRSTLELDKEYNIQQLGSVAGSITLYIHDPEVTVERAAELLLDVKEYLDSSGVPFYAMDLVLCEPRNVEGQLTGVEIRLYDFLYNDIYEDGLIQRVQQSWDLAQEHHAIQDGLKKEMEIIDTVLEEINP